MQALTGKRCFITGGSRGIGLAIARAFAAQGAWCTLIGRNENTLTSAADTLDTQGYLQRHYVSAFDVSNPNAWEKFAAYTKNQVCDILVNAAGVSQNSLLIRTEKHDVNEIITTNLSGTIWGCKYIIPKMMKQKTGCIINVASLLATHGGKGASVYAASKAGIVGTHLLISSPRKIAKTSVF
ncbi:hypothetical protein F4811DRAFT_554699 [Daldinia bambusicola]|nr:hypothetical protein F4811DRAFT_554699 [Daldinia bambusicola]